MVSGVCGGKTAAVLVVVVVVDGRGEDVVPNHRVTSGKQVARYGVMGGNGEATPTPRGVHCNMWCGILAHFSPKLLSTKLRNTYIHKIRCLLFLIL